MNKREKNPDETFFEIFPEGHKIIITERTPSGVWLSKEARNQKGQLIQERKRKFIDPKNPEKGVKYDHEKRFFYDEKGLMIREEGVDLDGPNKGHRWEKQFLEYDKRGKLILEKGRVLEQGENLKKEAPPHAWAELHLYDKNSEWQGKIGIITEGERKKETYIHGRVLLEEVDAFSQRAKSKGWIEK